MLKDPKRVSTKDVKRDVKEEPALAVALIHGEKALLPLVPSSQAILTKESPKDDENTACVTRQSVDEKKNRFT